MYGQGICIVEEKQAINPWYLYDHAEQKSLQYPQGSPGWNYAHKYVNPRQKDGRINSGYDKHGNLVAITVSPFSATFWDNIEDGVRPLIKAFVGKGYMPFSSCEGHGDFSSRFVYLAFGSEDKREKAERLIRKHLWFVPGIIIDRTSMPHNIQTNDDGSLERLSKAKLDMQSVRSFNTVFHKEEKFYCCLRITLFREYKDCWRKMVLTEWVTNRIIKLVQSERFPRYRNI